jgi:uncharacterized protein
MPDYADGKICYIEIPANDVALSAAFFEAAFGWDLRVRGDGSIAFDDTVGQVSGTWTTSRKAADETSILIYIMCSDLEASVDAVVANGGEITQPPGVDAPELTARFRDPAGNVFGLYQERTLQK